METKIIFERKIAFVFSPVGKINIIIKKYFYIKNLSVLHKFFNVSIFTCLKSILLQLTSIICPRMVYNSVFITFTDIFLLHLLYYTAIITI